MRKQLKYSIKKDEPRLQCKVPPAFLQNPPKMILFSKTILLYIYIHAYIYIYIYIYI